MEVTVSGINKVILLGRLGQDPTSKAFDDGGSVTNFSIATSRKWKGKDGEEKEEVEWVKCSAFGKLGEVCGKYLVKGKQVYLEGRLRTRTWDKDGESRYSTEVVVEKVEFLGDAKSAEAIAEKKVGENERSSQKIPPPAQTPQKKLKNFAPGAINEDDEIPF